MRRNILNYTENRLKKYINFKIITLNSAKNSII